MLAWPRTSRVNILGIEVSALPLPAVRAAIARAIRTGDRGFVTLTGVHGIMEAQRSTPVREAHNGAALVLADGKPLAVCGRLCGVSRATQVRGVDLMRAVLEDGEAAGWRMFFFGSTQAVLDSMIAAIAETYPRLAVVGSLSPPFRPLTDEEAAAVESTINESSPDIVWVGLSTPKQELWMHARQARLDATVLLGVGAAFDLIAGGRREAPMLVRRFGFEWLFRLLVEPRRLWRRYARNNPAFVLRLIVRWPQRVAAERS